MGDDTNAQCKYLIILLLLAVLMRIQFAGTSTVADIPNIIPPSVET